jgi:hypothetical protein
MNMGLPNPFQRCLQVNPIGKEIFHMSPGQQICKGYVWECECGMQDLCFYLRLYRNLLLNSRLTFEFDILLPYLNMPYDVVVRKPKAM